MTHTDGHTKLPLPAPPRPPPGARLDFIDLFAGLGGFHQALHKLGHRCVFASEIDEELRNIYTENFPDMAGPVVGDIRRHIQNVPQHQLLCAGFPCQPFSKSGFRKGFNDPTDGTLFHEVLKVIDRCNPYYVILENVGNFERHDGGNTWKVVKDSLKERGYSFKATEHSSTQGGHGLVSPHHLGHPQHRERFFVAAARGELPAEPFPPVHRKRLTQFDRILRDPTTEQEKQETALSEQQAACIEHWNRLLEALPRNFKVITPLWGDEFGAKYPYEKASEQPANLTARELEEYLGPKAEGKTKTELLEMLPSYARHERKFPDWKVTFIRQSRAWWEEARIVAPKSWLRELKHFPFSLRKLEWHGGEERDLWTCVLQFRPSGLRAKRWGQVPALVAMTATQIPILGEKRRFLTRAEGKLLQGFPEGHRLPARRPDAFAALGNAVHVHVIEEIGRRFVGEAALSVAPLATVH